MMAMANPWVFIQGYGLTGSASSRLRCLSAFDDVVGEPFRIRRAPIPDGARTGSEKELQGESNGGVGFFSHDLKCVEELSALAGEESVCREAGERGHGT